MKPNPVLLTFKKIIPVSFFILTLFIFFPTPSFATGNYLTRYLNQKALTNYPQAMRIISEWTESENDPVIIETNIFRINELIKYPELIDRAIYALNGIKASKTVQSNPSLKARADIFLNTLYLRKGRLQEAAALKNDLGFIDRYRIAGPFKNADLGRYSESEKDFYNNNINAALSKESNMWFDASADLTGKIDASDIFEDIRDSFILLESRVNAPADGKYILWLGKTGYTDIWIDGNKIFSGKKKHGFSFDQYSLELELSAGRHDLLVKTGDSKSGTKIALRLTDGTGAYVKDAGKENACKAKKAGTLIRASLFNAIDTLFSDSNIQEQNFYAGYLYYASGLSGEEGKEAALYFVKEGNIELASAVKHYLGLLENGSEKILLFRESINAFNKNAESINEIAEIKLKNNLIYETYQFIESITKINAQSYLINKLKAKAFIACGWDIEALKFSRQMKIEELKSSGFAIEASVNLKNKKYSKALPACKSLFEMDTLDFNNLNNLLECCIKTGRYDDADSLLNRCAELYPNNIILRLKHAELISNIKGPGASQPYLLSARKISPHHSEVLLKTGLAYHKLKKDDLALYYMKKALAQKPENEWLKNYIKIISNSSGSGNILNNNISKADPSVKLDGETAASWKQDDFVDIEKEIFRSIYRGDLLGQYNNIEKLLFAFPVKEESIPYYSDIVRFCDNVGFKRTRETLEKLIELVNSSSIDNSKKNLYLINLNLEMEKLLYLHKKKEAEKLTVSFFPLRRWSLMRPYAKYGYKDIDFPFLPEIVTNLKSADSKKKDLIIQTPKGELNFAKYLYPGEGIAYAAAVINVNTPVKIRVYSNSPYRFFINGKETIRNLENEIFRTCRIIRVWNSQTVAIMIKSFVSDKNNIRIIITDEDNKILHLESEPAKLVFADFNYSEEMDYPYNYFSGEKSRIDNIKDGSFRLGRFFHALRSTEAVKYYREAISADRSPIKALFLAEFLSENNSEENTGMNYESSKIIEDIAKEHRDFIPARRLMIKHFAASGSVFQINREYLRQYKKCMNYIPFRLDYAAYLQGAGLDMEFETEISSLLNLYPDLVRALKLKAGYYAGRNILKSAEIFKKILGLESSEDSLGALINIYKEQGRYDDIKALPGIYDTERRFKKELIEAMIDSGDYEAAKKAVFEELVIKNDPYNNAMLGDINYLEGSDPEMYWLKALFLNPSDYSLNDFLEYFNTGRIENPFKNYLYDNTGKDDLKNADELKAAGDFRNLKKQMIFLLNAGGSRFYCDDVILSRDLIAVNKRFEYLLPIPGEVHPVRIDVYNDGKYSDAAFEIDYGHWRTREDALNVYPKIIFPRLKEDSVIRISYYIDNPDIILQSSKFFSIPVIKINPDKMPAGFTFKVIAPKDLKVNFRFNKAVDIKSKTDFDKIIYSADLNTEDLSFSFSTMSNFRDFALWYTGLLNRNKPYRTFPQFNDQDVKKLLNSVYNYVAKEIELNGDALFNPQDQLETLNKKEGSVEDKVICAALILAERGIKSYIAFSGSQFIKDPSFVSPQVFTNIFLYIPLDIDTGIWMDFSGKGNKFGEVDKKMAGENALVIIKDGYEIKRITN